MICWRRVALLCATPVALAGCTPAPAAVPVPSSRPAATSAEPSLPAAPPPLPPLPSALPLPTASSGFPDSTAVSCAGNPGVDRIVALVRAQGVLDRTATVTARLGPLCAGTWQYTILAVPEHEPLQVVSQGTGTSLVLVTAGTDVCTDRVRTQAPIGIVVAAHC